MANYCIQCGRSLKQLAKFCPACGKPIGVSLIKNLDEKLVITDASDDGKIAPVSFVNILAQQLGLDLALRVIKTAYKPATELTKIIGSEKLFFTSIFLKYLQFSLIMLAFNNLVIIPLGKFLSYPLILEGPLNESDLLASVLSVISNAIAIAIMYLFPPRLFWPLGRHRIICTNVVLAMYVLLYIVAGDLVKFTLWILFRSFDMVSVVGWIINILLLVFSVWIYKRVLVLSWWSILIFSAFGLIFSFVWGFVLGLLGFVKFTGGITQ